MKNLLPLCFFDLRGAAVDESRGAVLGEFAFPIELAGCAKFLHHLRRGPIMGPICQSVDERAITRDFFLRLPLEDIGALIVPLVWRCCIGDKGVAYFEPMPAETMILFDSVSKD